MREKTMPGRLQTLSAATRGAVLPLPPRLARLYGELRLGLGAPRPRPRVLCNFVTTLDGVVSLNVKGHEGGGDISGFSAEDRMVMGLLRAVADVVILGGGSLAADPDGLWTPEAICPELGGDFRRLRQALGKAGPARRVVVTASGQLHRRTTAVEPGDGPLTIVTGRRGALRLAERRLPAGVEVVVVAGRGKTLAAKDILDAVTGEAGVGRGAAAAPARGATTAGVVPGAAQAPRGAPGGAAGVVLVEGGPRLLGSFYADRLIDEQFLTLSPQLAGRSGAHGRPGLVMGQSFAPRDPRWGTLSDVRRSGSHLFLRYIFERG